MSREIVFSSDRLFEVWRYTVSHRQLLIRSNKGPLSPTRLEILFKNVSFFSIPTVMRSISITKRDPNEEMPSHFIIPISNEWYIINTDGAVGYIAAENIITNEDELAYEDESPLISQAL